jgi:hypothetical protein
MAQYDKSESNPSRRVCAAVLITAVLIVGLVHFFVSVPSEPFFNNDETRHVMSGVFVRDFLHDLPFENPRQYAINYYLQYPALGIGIWPPFFYLVQGLLMSILGISFIVSKIAIWIFALVGGTYLFLLVLRTHCLRIAAVSVLLCGFAPLVFTLSGQVMLEVPALAMALAAVYHFARFLDDETRLHMAAAALASVLCAITRSDGIFLLPLFAVMLTCKGRWRLIRRLDVLGAGCMAVAIAAIAYLPTMLELWEFYIKTVRHGTVQGSSTFLATQNWAFYLRTLPVQIGWPILIAAIVGFLMEIRKWRTNILPYIATIVAVYFTFSPMAELDTRHAIYWVPAFSLLASTAMVNLAGRITRTWLGYGVDLLMVCAVIGFADWPQSFVNNYRQAAGLVLAESKGRRFCFFDGYLNGNFIYQIRLLDPERRIGVLRGDKLLYSTLVDEYEGYVEHVSSEKEITDAICRYAPELIVVEEPGSNLRVPQMLRRLLNTEKEKFQIISSIPILTNVSRLRGTKLVIYRNLMPNPAPDSKVKYYMPSLEKEVSSK